MLYKRYVLNLVLLSGVLVGEPTPGPGCFVALGNRPVCLCDGVQGAGEGQPPPPATITLAHFSWSLTRTRLDPKTSVLEPEEKQAVGDFHGKSAFSSALNCLLMPHFSQKKKKKVASSSFTKTYALNHTSCLFHSGIHLYIPCRDRLLSCVLPSSH